MINNDRPLWLSVEEKVSLLPMGAVSLKGKAALMPRGLMYFIDEYPYFQSTIALKSLIARNIKGAVIALNSTQGRPGAAVFRLLPPTVQAALFKVSDFKFNNPASPVIKSWMNLAFLLLSNFLMWRLARKLLPVCWAALAVLLYACLANYTLYVRHILPYDEALCLLLIGTLLTAKAVTQRGRRWPLLAGLAAGACYATCPGYFLAPVLMGLLLVASSLSGFDWRRLVRQLLSFGAGFVVIGLAFEGLARSAGTSYLPASRTLSGTILQGGRATGYSFVSKYLLVNEQLAGTRLLALFGVAAYQIVLRRKFADTNGAPAGPALQVGLLVATAACWMLYPTTVFVFHKLVFHSCIVHFLLLFMVLGAIYRIAAYEWQHSLQFVSYCLALISVASFVKFCVSYKHIAYDEDVLYGKAMY